MSNFGAIRVTIGFLAVVALGACVAPLPASADATYTFKNTGIYAASFSFTVPSIITGTGLTYITSNFTASDPGGFFVNNDCGPITFITIQDPSDLVADSLPSETVHTGICFVLMTFNFVPIDSFGTFTTLSGTGTLTITQTPEPGSLLLFGTGLLGLGPFIRRARHPE